MTEVRRLSITVLGIAIALIVVGMATNYWGCGNLFDSCQNHSEKDAVIAVIALLLLGLLCIAIVFLLDLIGLCSDKLVTQNGYIITRFVLLYVGAASLLTGVLVHTGKITHAWSYFITVVGCVFALQVAFLAILSSRCVAVRERRVVRTVRA